MYQISNDVRWMYHTLPQTNTPFPKPYALVTGPATCAACAIAASSGDDPGAINAIWFPFNKILSRWLVRLLPSGSVTISVTSSRTFGEWWVGTGWVGESGWISVWDLARKQMIHHLWKTHRIHVIIKPTKCTDKFTISFHYDPNFWTNTFIYQF